MIGPPLHTSTCLAKRPDYTPDYKGDYRPRVFAPAVVSLFMKQSVKMNRQGGDYRSHGPVCSHPVVTLKPAELRDFSTSDYLTTPLFIKRDKVEKEGRRERYTRGRSHWIIGSILP